jgi:FkbM family methyltransferase
MASGRFDTLSLSSLIRKFNRYYAKYSINLQYDGILKRTSVVVNGKEIFYYYRPFSFDSYIAKEIFELEYYKPLTLEQDDGVIDIGSHIGLFTLYCDAFNAHVFGFEPEKTNHAISELNLDLNDSSSLMLNTAAELYSGKREFYPSTNSGNGTVIPFNKNQKSITVPCSDIRTFLPCDILKIDAEGIEYDILEGIDLNSIKKEIIIEFHYHVCDWEMRLRDISSNLRDLGFTLVFSKDFSYNGYRHWVRQLK